MTSDEFSQRIVAMQDTLYRVSSSILPQLCDREDAVQECIRKAWQKRERLRDDRMMQTWVIRILINECYDLLRRRKRELPVDVLPEQEAPPQADISLYSLFMSLEEKFRIPAVLHYIEGYDLEEISQMLRLPLGTVKSRLFRGRIRLKAAFNEEEAYSV